jgi:hypothetical protein
VSILQSTFYKNMSSFTKILVSLLLTTPSVFAAAITYDGDFTNIPGRYPLTFSTSVPKFNPAIGVLESVEFLLVAGASANVEMESEGPVAGAGSARLFGVTTGTFSGLSATVVLGKTLADNIGADDEIDGPNFAGVDYKNFGLLSDNKSASAATSTSLGRFIGLDGLALDVTDNQAWAVSGTGDSASRITLSASTMHWEVTYNFAPVPLPEPSTLSFGISAISCMALKRRRK